MRRTRAALATVIASLLCAGVLAACGLGGGAFGDCTFDVAGPDAYNVGAPASYTGTIQSCSNAPFSTSDQDQYLYPVAPGDVTVVCGIEETGAGDGVHLTVYRDPGTGAQGAYIGDVQCSGPVEVVAADDLEPGDHILIEVDHAGPGSRVAITVE